MKKVKFSILITTIFLLIIPVFSSTVSAKEVKEEKVYLGGKPFGIKMFCDGVMVIKTEDVNSGLNSSCPAEEAGIKANDIIISADNQKLRSNEELSQIIKESEGREIPLTIKREGKTINTAITPCKNSQGIYKAGMWVKDSAAGIGTVTFYSGDTENFCGLGHGICDNETGMLIPIGYGEVCSAFIASVTKSSDSKVGTLNGYFTNDKTGTALLNNPDGIYGKTENEIKANEIVIADDKEVKTGKAQVYTTISGQTPKLYDAEILRVNQNTNDSDIVIRITDEELLEKTGGIVQGMSGSPIIQNGKLVGAVTHVIVDNVDCGYGIFAEKMMETMKESCR